ncbi:MAG: YdcH family protein [Sphingomonadaceae bacterium]
MSHTPHELADEFPQDRDLIHSLKQENAHFARLAEEYHTVNRTIHRIESETEAASDERSEELKKQRLALADELSAILAKARTPA